MKKSLVAAAFLLAAAGTIDMSAGTTAHLQGADTVTDLTSAILSACPGTTGPYDGTGSGSGQSAMLAGAQQVAPMSRFLDSDACTGTAGAATCSQRPALRL